MEPYLRPMELCDWHILPIYTKRESSQTSTLVKRLSVTAKVPKARKPAAGFDIVANVRVTIGPGKRETIATGLALIVPGGIRGKLYGRTALAVKELIYTLRSLMRLTEERLWC